MKYINIIRAQAPLQRIAQLRLPIKENKKSRAIYKMVLDIIEFIKYIQTEEMKISEKYKGVPQSDGKVNFGNDQDGVNRANLCSRELVEFENSEADWEHEIIKLSEESLTGNEDFSLSPEELFYLEGFVEFD